jgi:hypothetical protein
MTRTGFAGSIVDTDIDRLGVEIVIGTSDASSALAAAWIVAVRFLLFSASRAGSPVPLLLSNPSNSPEMDSHAAPAYVGVALSKVELRNVRAFFYTAETSVEESPLTTDRDKASDSSVLMLPMLAKIVNLTSTRALLVSSLH